MAEYKNRLPPKRVDVPVMVRIWLDIMGINLQAWNIPQEILQELTQLVMEARAALDAAPPTKRTKVLTAKVEAAFDKLEAKMRFIKERYFLKPPRATAAAGSFVDGLSPACEIVIMLSMKRLRITIQNRFRGKAVCKTVQQYA